MGTERNNGNDSVIFEISSKGENMQNINRYTEKKEQQLSDKYIHNYIEITKAKDYYSSVLLSSCIFKINRCNTSRTTSTLFMYIELLR